MKQLFIFITVFMTAFATGLATSVSAQTGAGDFFVKVIDEKQQPVSLVNISLFRLRDTMLIATQPCGENGIVGFRAQAAGQYLLEASRTGFTKTSIAIDHNLPGEMPDTFLVRMKRAPSELSGVTVVARKPVVEFKPDRVSMNVQQSNLSSGLTVMELLEKVPGVTVDKDGNIGMQGKSGVQVLIDGRPTYMNATDLARLLKTMPADQVSTIECLHAPSAKYDATGNAGIILIRTKRKNSKGLNMSLNTGGGYGNYAKAHSDISINYRHGKWGLSGQYGYRYNKESKELVIDRRADKGGIPVLFNQYSYGTEETGNHAARLAVDYQAGKRSVLALNLSANSQKIDHVMDAMTLIGIPVADSSLGSHSYGRQRISHYTTGLSYQYSFPQKGRELTVDADYAYYRSGENMGYENRFFDAGGAPYRPDMNLRSQAPSTINIRSVKTDYTHPFAKQWLLETGLKYSSVTSSNHIRFEEQKTGGWENDLLRSNIFTYDEQVLAGYANLSGKVSNWSYQGGLRAEHTISEGVSPTLGKKVRRAYTDLFPNAQVSYIPNANHSFSITYNRRIQRPNYQTLNPFVYFIDQYAYSAGNAYLNPQYANNISLSYVFKKKYMIQAGMSLTRDVIAQVLLPDSANQALYETHENLHTEKIYRLTINAPVKITKWWNASFSVNGMYMGYHSNNLRGKTLDNGQYFVLINGSQQCNLGKGYSLEISGKFTSPLTYASLKLRPENFVDMGMGKKLFSGKGNLKFVVNDVFNIRRQKINSVYPGFDYKLTQKLESRIFRVSFSYSFGNSGIQTRNGRESGARPEMERLKL